jgi:hypothetical protein
MSYHSKSPSFQIDFEVASNPRTKNRELIPAAGPPRNLGSTLTGKANEHERVLQTTEDVQWIGLMSQSVFKTHRNHLLSF